MRLEQRGFLIENVTYHPNAFEERVIARIDVELGKDSSRN
jgi:hypothetical protein